MLTRGIFLVRNYEAVRQKQEQLWREEEFERRRERDEEKNSWIRDGHDAGSCVKTGPAGCLFVWLSVYYFNVNFCL